MEKISFESKVTYFFRHVKAEDRQQHTQTTRKGHSLSRMKMIPGGNMELHQTITTSEMVITFIADLKI